MAWQNIVQDPGAWESQTYGCTDYNAEWYRPDCAGMQHFHAGIDIAAAFHASVLSPRDGVVVALPVPGGDSRYPYYLGDQSVGIRTADGWYIELGHLDVARVAMGQAIKAGQLIGLVGTRGASSGPHLHLEVRRDGARQGPPWSAVFDPAPFLTVKQPASAPTPAPPPPREIMRRDEYILSDGVAGEIVIPAFDTPYFVNLVCDEKGPATVEMWIREYGRGELHHETITVTPDTEVAFASFDAQAGLLPAGLHTFLKFTKTGNKVWVTVHD